MSKRSEKFKKYANDARARAGLDATFVRFSTETGKWSVGKDTNHQEFDGRECLAEIPDLMRGYRKFVDKAVPVYAVTCVAGDVEPPPRDALGDLDEAAWPKSKFSDGKKDPWALVSILPLIDLETGETIAYATESASGFDAIASLADAFAVRPEDDTALPVISLSSHSRVGSNGTRYHFPILRIMRWEERPADARHLVPPPLPLLPTPDLQGTLALGGERGEGRPRTRNGHGRPGDDIPF